MIKVLCFMIYEMLKYSIIHIVSAFYCLEARYDRAKTGLAAAVVWAHKLL